MNSIRQVNENDSPWKSRRVFIMVVLCYMLGTSTFVILPNTAVINGAAGYIVGYLFSYLCLGIPLLYMEYVISQFTSRDCIDVWKARGCLSHVGYLLIIWQVFIVFFNHILNCFTAHYFLISFENPIPYYLCGEWKTNDCNILISNHTLNEDCIKSKDPLSYCDQLYTTFPEHQYWRRQLLGVHLKGRLHIAWRVTLASGLITIITYLGCFRRKASVKWLAEIFTLFPMAGYIIFMIGSMLQKGLVMKYEEAIDASFSVYFRKFHGSSIVNNILHNLGVGTGMSFNLGSTTSFRTPCYANTVIVVVICAAFAILSVCTTAMMFCPYAYVYGISPGIMITSPMSMVFEKTTRLLHEYQYKSFWLILIFSCNSFMGIGTNVILVSTLLDVVASRCKKVAQYPGMSCFIGLSCIFFFTIPLLGKLGMDILSGFSRFVSLISLFIAMTESLVFVIWYGLGRFTEDVHFMQGIQPGNFMKIVWVTSSVILGYVFCTELYYDKVYSRNSIGDLIGFCTLIAFLGITIILCVLKILRAAYKRKIMSVLELDPTWGPRNDVLQRSRAMFTAQAMTKEYMYRQYHLQAGILQRQRLSNSRKDSCF